MNPTVSLEPAARVPESATVRDYDELPEWAQVELPAMVGRDGVPLRCEDAGCGDAGFVHGEYVKYTGYYRVRIAE